MMKRMLKGLLITAILLAGGVGQPAQAQPAEKDGLIDSLRYDGFVDLEKGQSADIRAFVSDKQDYESFSWKCANHNNVDFESPDGLQTRMEFSEPGYYMILAQFQDSQGNRDVDSAFVNVFIPGQYEKRLEDMLSLMTVEEKISQLGNGGPAIERLNLSQYRHGGEALHGVMDFTHNTTIFPSPIGLGSTWNTDLIHRMATAISDEARILARKKGKSLVFFSPNLNIGRDPRWGRNDEAYSEDPYLMGQMGKAFITGLQGDHPHYLKAVASPKHYVANNEDWKRHFGSAYINKRSLHEYFLPAFKTAFTEAGAASTMAAFNEINDLPCHANRWLLTDLLRNQWGFDGYVVADHSGVRDLHLFHRYAPTRAKANAEALKAGIDMTNLYYPKYMKETLEQGLVDESHIDTAVRRILRTRFKLGVYDPPQVVPYTDIPGERLESSEHQELALQTARESMVLLKNEGVLPFDDEKMESIAVIGPNAHKTELGNYSGFPSIKISPLEGIKERAKDQDITVRHARGSHHTIPAWKPIPSRYLVPMDHEDQQGLEAEYFNNPDYNGYARVARIDPTIDFDWGEGSPHDSIKNNWFSARWQGYIEPPETGTYKLAIKCKEAVRLRINGQLVYDGWEHGWKRHKAPGYAWYHPRLKEKIVELDMVEGQRYGIEMVYRHTNGDASMQLMWDYQNDPHEKAVEAAQNSDAAVVVVGLSTEQVQESFDRHHIEMPQAQQEMIEAVHQANPNTVVVVVSGTPFPAESFDEVPGIVQAWYAGQAQGTAIAEVLFGDYNPGGKLSQTYYRSTEQLPPFNEYNIMEANHTYQYMEEEPMFPFGHGLSYTSFEYSDMEATSSVDREGKIRVSLDVTNTGDRRGDEVVQLYVRDREASVEMPNKQLKRFERVSLDAGETRQVSFELPAQELHYYDEEKEAFVVEPGFFELMIGSSSADIRLSDETEVTE